MNKTMDSNRTENIRASIDALSESLSTAWSYLLLLRSLRDAYHSRPRMNMQFGRVINQYWQGLWDALFARIGTFFDRTAGTHSLPGLLTQLRRSKDPKLSKLAASAQSFLDNPGESAIRMLRWRHEVVSHRVAAIVASKFDAETEVHLEDVAAVLERVEQCLNDLARGALGFTIDIKKWNAEYEQEAGRYLELVEIALNAQSPSVPV
jgi:hypothetical protein